MTRPRADTAELPVSPQQARPVLAALLSLYGTKADAISNETEALAGSDLRSLGTLLAHRDELAAIDRLLDHLGWAVPQEPVILRGERRLLWSSVADAVGDAVDTLNAELRGPRLDLDAIRRALARVETLVALAEHLQR